MNEKEQKTLTVTPLDIVGPQGTLEAAAAIGQVFAAAGYWSDARSAAKATVKIILGRELGLNPAQAINGTYIIEGKLILSATMLGALIKRSGKYNYRVLEKTDRVCRIAFFENGEKIGEETFTIDQAKRAGLLGKQNWRKYPEAMLFSRALSAGARTYCPDILAGMPTYIPDEATDISGREIPTDLEPEVIDVEATETAPTTVEESAPEPVPTPEPAPESVPKQEPVSGAVAPVAQIDDDPVMARLEALPAHWTGEQKQEYIELYEWEQYKERAQKWELEPATVPQMQKAYMVWGDALQTTDKKAIRRALSRILSEEITTLKGMTKGQLSRLIDIAMTNKPTATKEEG